MIKYKLINIISYSNYHIDVFNIKYIGMFYGYAFWSKKIIIKHLKKRKIFEFFYFNKDVFYYLIRKKINPYNSKNDIYNFYILDYNNFYNSRIVEKIQTTIKNNIRWNITEKMDS